MTRAELTEKVLTTKLKKGLTWGQIAKEVGRSPVWTTAALLGQMTMSKEEAQKANDAIDAEKVTAAKPPKTAAKDSSKGTDATAQK